MSDSVRPMALLRVGGQVLLFLLLLIPSASSQFYNVLYVDSGCCSGIRFGNSVAATGDMDADGKSEFIIGAPNWDTSATWGTDRGVAYVYSGSDGHLLYVKHGGEFQDLKFGFSVAGAGDVDADGKADFIVGEPYLNPQFPVVQTGQNAYVFSGATGDVLCTLCDPVSCGESIDHFGISVAGVGDVNGDNRSDVIVGAHIAPQSGLYSPASGAATLFGGSCNVITSKPGVSVWDSMGYSVAGAGRINGDPTPDFIIGAPAANPNGKADAGSAYIYSGMGPNYSLLHQIDGVAAGDNLGLAVAGIGDIYGNDGRSEFIVGAPWHDTLGMNNVGKVYVFNGANGQPVFILKGEAAADLFGRSVSGGGDVNGDGKPDFIVGAIKADSGGLSDVGAAYVYSGADASLIFKKYGANNYANLGHSVSATADINGDSKADVIVGKPGPSNSKGSTLVFVNCAKAKGDMDGINGITPADLVCLNYCIYSGSSSCGCDRCYADMNCDGTLSSADYVILSNFVYNGTPLPC